MEYSDSNVLPMQVSLFLTFRLPFRRLLGFGSFRMEGETSKIKKLALVERVNLNMSDPMNADLSSIFIEYEISNCAERKVKTRPYSILIKKTKGFSAFDEQKVKNINYN